MKLKFELCDLGVGSTEDQLSYKKSTPVNGLNDSKVNFNTLSTFTPEGKL